MADPRDVFVGRDQELRGLTAALDDALAGRGRLVMLVGEPGIGKTRTAEELSTVARARDANVLWGRCSEERGAPPFWPWIQIVRTYLNALDAAGLQKALGSVASQIVQMVPEIRERLPTLPASAPVGDLEAARFRLYDAIVHLLKRACESRPQILVLDDLHWADASSLGLLEFLVPAISDLPLLILGTYRDVEVGRGHPLFRALGGLSRQRTFSRVLLRGLTQRDVEGVFEAATGARPPRRLTNLVYQNTEGNPLFVRELVFYLDQEGLLNQARSADPSMVGLRLPEGVREVIVRRMERLSQPCNAVMTMASAIGQDFSVDVLRRAVTFVNTSLPEEDTKGGTASDPLLDAIDEALAARIVEDVPGAPGRIRFTHALVQQTLEQEISQAQRSRLHALIAEAIEELYGADSPQHAGQIARHLSMAGAMHEPEKLMRSSLLAGEQALHSLGFQEAVYHFETAEQAAEVARKAAGTRGLWNEEAARAHSAGMARIWHGLARARIGTAGLARDRQRAWDTLTRAFEAYLGLGDNRKAAEIARTPMASSGVTGLVDVTERALRIAEPDSVGTGFLFTRYATALLDERGDLSGAHTALKNALQIATRTQDSALEAWSHVHLSHLAFAECDYRTTVKENLETLRLGVAADDELAGRVYLFAIPAMIAIGDLESPRTMADAFLMVSARVQTQWFLALAPLCAWAAAAARGDRQTMQAARGRMLERPGGASEIGAAFLEASELLTFGPADRGLDILRRTSVDAGLDYMFSDAILGVLAPAGRSTGNSAIIEVAETLAHDLLTRRPVLPRLTRPAQQAFGFASVARGDPAAAAKAYAEVLPSKGQFGRYGGFSIDRLLGLLASTTGDTPAAHRHFEEAISSCERAGFLPELALSCYDYSELLLAAGGASERRKALSLLAKGRKTATELEMAPLLQRFAALEERIASSQSAGPTYPDGLTEREVGVLRLIAAGRSNSEIANTLVITPNTAAKHVANILSKINASNRAEAASYAHEKGLVERKPE